MTSQLPAPLREYFDAVNRQDARAATVAFADDAVVRDEGHTHEGHAAIAAWIRETTEKYQFTAEVRKITMDDGAVRVAALVSGNFPGSPITLRYAFSLNNGKIARLEIGA